MKTTIELLAIGILSSILFTALALFIRNIAVKKQLVDTPNNRKIHQSPIPLIGGITIGITVLLISGISNEIFNKDFLPILFGGYLLLIVGIIDDKTDMRAIHKLLIQLCLSFIFSLSGLRINTLYGLFGIYEINIYMQYLLTIFIITSTVNAFNFMDGIDGLAASIALTGFFFLLIISINSNNIILAKLNVILIGSIISFLRLNFSVKNKIFLGDSGSLFLGFLLVTLGIYFLEKNRSNIELHSSGILYLMLVFLIPISDFIRVFISRLLKNVSPFKADKTHLHHFLIEIGLSHKKTVILILTLNSMMIAINFFLIEYGLVPVLIISLVILTIFYNLVFLITTFNSWKNKIKVLEKSNI